MRAKLGLHDDSEVAALLGISLGRLRNRRTVGDAPISSKAGNTHLTSIAELRKYLARKQQRSAKRVAE